MVPGNRTDVSLLDHPKPGSISNHVTQPPNYMQLQLIEYGDPPHELAALLDAVASQVAQSNPVAPATCVALVDVHL